jgi:O-antigen/teichoic acid export membrane protein
MQKINGLLNEIAFPAFSSIQADGEKVTTYLLKAIRLISFFAFPIFFGLASVAPVFVELVLGSKWSEAAYPLAVLSMVMPLRMIVNIYASTLRGVGRAGVSVMLTILTGVIMVSGFAIGTRWGIKGVCLSWLVTVPITTFLVALIARPFCGFGAFKLIKELFVPLLASGVMFAVVMYSYPFLKSFLSESTASAILILIAQVLLVVMVYVPLTLIFNRNSYREIQALRSNA